MADYLTGWASYIYTPLAPNTYEATGVKRGELIALGADLVPDVVSGQLTVLGRSTRSRFRCSVTPVLPFTHHSPHARGATFALDHLRA